LSNATTLTVARFIRSVILPQMTIIQSVLPYVQITLSILLITSILLQQSGSGMGGVFGGDNFSAGFHTRRGSEKILFNASIILGILFAVTAFVALII
jgi:preprotein translocase subunit SecG